MTSRWRDPTAIALLAVAAAAGAQTAGCHPTGNAALDRAYPAALAVLVTLAASRASRGVLLLMAGVALALSRNWVILPGVAVLAIAFAATFRRRADPVIGALTGALGIQVVLRWHPIGFFGLTALIAGAVVLVVLAAGWWGSSRLTRVLTGSAIAAVVILAVVFAVPVAIAGLASKDAVDNGSNVAKSALSEIESGDAPGAVANLRTASADLASAYHRSSPWWTDGGAFVPVVAQQRRAVLDVTKAGRDLTAQAATEAGVINYHNLTYHDGKIDLASVQALVGPVVSLDRQITATQNVIAGIRSPWLVTPLTHPLDTLRSQLAKARKEADLASAGVRDAPAILGADGPRHYLVVFMTPAETRGLEGFVGAYAELVADQGKVTIVRSGRANTDLEVHPPKTTPKLTGLQDYMFRYGTFQPTDHFEDLGYSPDFPTVADAMSQVYPQVGGDHIDGVLALDPFALQALLGFTGPIPVSGSVGQLTSTNAADVLIRQQYVNASTNEEQAARHDLLQQALPEAFAKLATGSLPDPEALSAALDPIALQGRLLFWTPDPSQQPLLQLLHLEGSFPSAGTGDLLAVTVANDGNSKIDAYLHESVDDDVTYNPSNGAEQSTVTLALHNEAPAKGLPAYVIGSYPGSGLPLGTSELWVSLYSPLNLTGATIGGSPVKFSAAIPELGVYAYSVYVKIPAESTATVELHLAGQITASDRFSEAVRLQPLANPTSVTVNVTAASNWAESSETLSTWHPGSNMVQAHEWEFSKR